MEKMDQSDSMLVRGENLDQLLNLAGEVIIASSNLGIATRNLQSLRDQGTVVGRDTVDMMKDLSETTADISSNLHKLVQSIRTIDLKDVSFRARRMARDLARRTGKRIRLDVEGDDTVVDKSIVEKLYDPIAHQLRNAIDHGIEDVATRSKNGKPEEGRILLKMRNAERDTVIEIQDDGAGIDIQALREKAIAEGVVSESAPFTADDALDFMCRPGVSTSKTLTEISGRGVGMDVVRSAIGELGGSMSLETTPGEGSTFTFSVPLLSAVNIMDGLVVEANGVMYAFPILSVVSTLSMPRSKIVKTLEKGKVVRFLDQLIPLHNLDQLLNGARVDRAAEPDSDICILIVEHKDERLALEVDDFVNPQKLVIIPINEVLPIPEIVGATILGGRTLGFIIDVQCVVDKALGKNTIHVNRQTSAAVEESSSEGGAERDGDSPIEPSRQAEMVAASDESVEDVADKNEFLIEIERLLGSLNEEVFGLESDPANTERVNGAFRLFHTIKGNFMMIGMTGAGNAVHAVESVLDAVRSGRMGLDPTALDLVMDGISFIENTTHLAREGGWDERAGNDIIERGAALVPRPEEDVATTRDVAGAEVELSHEAAYRSLMHRKRGTPCYQCYLEFDAGRQPAFLIACMIYRRFCELGDVLGTTPTLENVEKGDMEGKFKLLLASTTPQERLEAILNDLLRKHYGAKTINLVRFE